MTDDEFYGQAFDVARNLVAYDKYGGESDRALRALVRRTAGCDRAACAAALDLLSAVVATVRETVPRHVRPREEETGNARFEDIDFDACMAEVDVHRPGAAIEAKRAAVSWAILYDYLM